MGMNSSDILLNIFWLKKKSISKCLQNGSNFVSAFICTYADEIWRYIMILPELKLLLPDIPQQHHTSILEGCNYFQQWSVISLLSQWEMGKDILPPQARQYLFSLQSRFLIAIDKFQNIDVNEHEQDMVLSYYTLIIWFSSTFCHAQ